jgi:hypothetical protein
LPPNEIVIGKACALCNTSLIAARYEGGNVSATIFDILASRKDVEELFDGFGGKKTSEVSTDSRTRTDLPKALEGDGVCCPADPTSCHVLPLRQ